MNSKRNAFCMLLLVFVIGMGNAVFAQPVFENNTPVGFSPADSTRQERFVTDTDITVLVDLNESANATYPVIGNFQKVEASVPFFSDGASAGYMSQAVEIDDNGVVHRAWIQQRGVVDVARVTSTPLYGVVYAKSFDGGSTFTDTVSVSGSMRFDMITPNIDMTSGFSTVDLVVDSKGNPRVSYAMDFSGDGLSDHGPFTAAVGTDQRVRGSGQARSFNGVFFNYSNDGGSSWLPSNNTVALTDTSTVGSGAALRDYPGRHTAFPRMAITATDDIFIVYQAGLTGLSTASDIAPDIMLTKMDADSLLLGSAQPVNLGPTGNLGSLGGVRVDPQGEDGVTPDIAIGDDDVLHIVWFTPGLAGGAEIQHKTIPAEDWSVVGGGGLDQTNGGATIGTFNAIIAATGATGNLGMEYLESLGAAAATQAGTMFQVANTLELHLFPTVVVDRERTPDRVYALWKHTDAISTDPARDENIRYSTYNYDGQVGGGAAWGSVAPAFPIGGTTRAVDGYVPTGGGLFQNGAIHQIESNWAYTDRVAAVVDDRIPGVRGDVHIVFSGGASHGSALGGFPGTNGNANGLYYARFNGTEWELPQVVATSANGTADGVLAKHRQLFEPSIAMRSGDDNVYLTFVGGSPSGAGVQVGGRNNRRSGGSAAGPLANTAEAPGFGFRSMYVNDIQPLPYFKVIGRATTFEDKSVPVGAFQYQLTYNPINPQTAQTNNLVSIVAADNQDGSGIGGATPGASNAAGGFLTGQWQNMASSSLGVSSLNPGEAGAVFKGAVGQNQAQNDAGIFQGQIDEDGSSGFAEWGDDGDKNGLLVKLNVLGSDSATNVFVIRTSSAAKGPGGTVGEVVADSSSQSITLEGIGGVATVIAAISGEVATSPGFLAWVKPITASAGTPVLHPGATGVRSAAMGSYFIMGPDIDIVAANRAPSVSVLSPDASTIGSGAFANETFSIQYTLFDSDDNSSDTDSDTLRTALYAYPDNGLRSVQDIKTFATLIVDERDISTASTRVATDPAATGDFAEGSSSGNTQTYAWDNPGTALQAAFGWAPITRTLDSNYYIYIIGDDGVNPAVFAVSQGALRVRHIPIIRSVSPVAADTVDTGEYSNLAKANPYKLKFTVVDYDDNAQMRLFLSTSSSLAATAVTVTGTFPNQALALAGATEIQLSDTLRTDEDIEFYFDVTAQGSARDSVIVQGNYFIYAVAADEDTFALGISSNSLAIRHSPAFEFTAPLKDINLQLDPSQQDRFTIEWQRGRSDQDLDGNAIISLYYTGIDPNSVNYSGTDSTQLLATSGTNPGNAVLITGNIREDDEGANDQYVWNFRNPPGALPKQFRPAALDATAEGALQGHRNPHLVQVGSTVDTAWVYAVLHDSLGNTRVQAGGSILLASGQDETFQPAPSVIMKTPPTGGQTIVNGDIVRLEWDAFLIDDGTGTDDAYLRLYAAPKGKYSTLTSLESNASGAGGNADVFIINSTTGQLLPKSSLNTAQAYDPNLKVLRESGDNFILWDTKTTSFKIQGTPTEFDIFIAGSLDRRFGDHIYVGNSATTEVDSVASGFGSQAQKAVLSKAPGVLRVEGADPIYSIELGPGTMTAATGDTLSMDLLVNSQNSSIDLMAIHLNVPRNYFEIIDMDAATTGLQPFADSTGAFRTPSTIAQNDTTQGTEQFIKLNFVESIINGEVIGNALGDSSQV
ncbi:MAG: hypothetical protein HOI20_17640, partial [Gemmatimonadetes bacterium]|nr:hypothetical protein [Gemmatimonadota bacterium]